MHKGSTPTYTFEFENLSLSGITKLSVVFAQNKEIVLEKGLNDVDILSDNKMSITLNEDETLKFKADNLRNAYVDVQFKFGYENKRIISDIVQVIIKPILKEDAL